MNFASKLMIGSVGILLTVAVINIYYSYKFSEVSLREEFAYDAEKVVEVAAEFLKPVSQNKTQTCQFATQILRIKSLEYIKISHDGNIICDVGNDSFVRLDLSNPQDFKDNLEKNRVFTTFGSVECQNKNCKNLDIEIGISFSRLDKSLDLQWKSILKNTIALTVAIVLFLLVFSFFVRRRLDVLSKACEKIEQGFLDEKIELPGNDEISSVARAMSQMCIKLKLSSEEKDKQRQMLTHSSKLSALGEMASGISHEINNPLAIIKLVASQLQILLKDGKLNDDLLQKKLTTISNTSERISKIIYGLKTFTHDGSNDPLKPCPLAPLIEDALTLIRDRYRLQGVDLEVLPFDPTISIQAVPSQISQLLLNLVSNAFDAVEKNNSTDRWVKIKVEAENDFIQIKIIDSNKGISKSVQDKLFQPFFTTKEVGKGTGIGLSISLGIAKRHNGTLVYDEHSPNTCFVLRIPKGFKEAKLSA